MRIDHIAIWVKDLEASKNFYEKYFEATANAKYHNPNKKFESYFLAFDNGCRLELMQKPGILEENRNYDAQKMGIIHIALSVGSKENVDKLTNQLRADGIRIVGQPRTTGDGYYESVILDLEDNIIEITE